MAEITFVYNGAVTTLQCKINDKLRNICEKFCIKVQTDINKLIFIYGGDILELELAINQIIKQINQDNNKIKILVYDKNSEFIGEKNERIIKSKDIICPKCGELCLINFQDYKIILNNCKNKHENIITINEFDRTQNINENLIMCDICNNNNKGKTYNNIFYTCGACKKNICPLCKDKHNKDHKIIDYDNKNYICNKHNEQYSLYCDLCKENLCLRCDTEHNNHKIISYIELKPNIDNIKNKIKELKDTINKFNNDIDEIIKFLKNLKENIENYCNIYNNILNQYDIKNRNYQIFYNINNLNNLNNDKIIIDLKDIIDEKNFGIKFGKIFNLNDKIYKKCNEKKDDKNIIINFNEQDKIKNLNKNNDKNLDDSKYNLDFKPNSPYIKYNYPITPLIGLQDIGAICYINSTLQCFCHIEKFVEFFKYNQFIINKVRNNKNNLTSSFKLLIENLWPNNYGFSNNKKDYAPYEFKDKIALMNPIFKGLASNNPKDLINFIIMTLHEELNKGKNNANNNIYLGLDQRNQQLMLNSFCKEFMEKNKSIISDIFYGVECNILECGRCYSKTFNYQTYFLIEFPLEECIKYKSNYTNNMFNNNNNNIEINQVSLYDCFEYYRKIKILSGDKANYCNYCEQACNFTMCKHLTTGPEILILLFDRGNDNKNIRLYYFENINLINFLELNNLGNNYKLIGVISYSEESGNRGSFIAYCRDPISGSWNKYNDSLVTEINNFMDEVIISSKPHLLFYQKVN